MAETEKYIKYSQIFLQLATSVCYGEARERGQVERAETLPVWVNDTGETVP